MSKMNYSIVVAVEEDTPGLAECLEKMYSELREYGLPFTLNHDRMPEILQAAIRSRFGAVFVAKEDNRSIKGFIIVSVSKFDSKYLPEFGSMIGKITDVYVVPESRREGLAMTLYSKAEEWLIDSGVSFIELDVLKQNTLAECFWGRCGFESLSTLMYKKI